MLWYRILGRDGGQEEEKERGREGKTEREREKERERAHEHSCSIFTDKAVCMYVCM